MAAGKLNNARPTIFSERLSPENNDGWPVPTSWQLKDECYSFLAAAADTTGNAMSTACYHTLANRGIYARLKDELVTAFPDASQNLDFSTLEKLPYLVRTPSSLLDRYLLTGQTAVIKEGLRFEIST